MGTVPPLADDPSEAESVVEALADSVSAFRPLHPDSTAASASVVMPSSDEVSARCICGPSGRFDCRQRKRGGEWEPPKRYAGGEGRFHRFASHRATGFASKTLRGEGHHLLEL